MDISEVSRMREIETYPADSLAHRDTLRVSLLFGPVSQSQSSYYIVMQCHILNCDMLIAVQHLALKCTVKQHICRRTQATETAYQTVCPIKSLAGTCEDDSLPL